MNLRSWLEAQSGSISPAGNIRSRLAGTARSAKRTSCEATRAREASSCEATSLRRQGARSAVSGHTACASNGLWAYLVFRCHIQLVYLKEFRISNLYGTCFRSLRTCSIVLHMRSQPALKAFPGRRDPTGLRMCTGAGAKQPLTS